MAISNLGLASNAAIITTLSNLKVGYNSRNSWVDPSNIYIADTLTKLKNGFRSPGSIVQSDIVEYVASSVFIHCINGWSYLSTAINSYLEGDFGAAIHNAYYAELRSIMSFLAAQGIGVFDKDNVIIDSMGNVHKATSTNASELRTHVFAKKALDEWLSDPNNSNSLLKQIVIKGCSLKDWFDATGFPPSSALPGLVATDWLKTWSLDVATISDEVTFRNFVSYRPQCFDLNFSRLSENIKYKLPFMIDIWRMCSPNNQFELSILRLSMEKLYGMLIGVTDLNYLDDVTDWGRMFTDLGLNPTDASSRSLIQYFKRQVNSSDSSLFQHAKRQNPVPITEIDTDPISIISRACLLLLFTTKIAEEMLRKSVTSKADLKFWYNRFGVRQGYWDMPNEPYLFSDLWVDIEIELDEMQNWLNKTGISHTNSTFRQDLRDKIYNCKHVDKSYLWLTM